MNRVWLLKGWIFLLVALMLFSLICNRFLNENLTVTVESQIVKWRMTSLNDLHQDDPRLIEVVKKILIKPKNQANVSLKEIGLGEYGQVQKVEQILKCERIACVMIVTNNFIHSERGQMDSSLRLGPEMANTRQSHYFLSREEMFPQKLTLLF